MQCLKCWPEAALVLSGYDHGEKSANGHKRMCINAQLVLGYLSNGLFPSLKFDVTGKPME